MFWVLSSHRRVHQLIEGQEPSRGYIICKETLRSSGLIVCLFVVVVSNGLVVNKDTHIVLSVHGFQLFLVRTF